MSTRTFLLRSLGCGVLVCVFALGVSLAKSPNFSGRQRAIKIQVTLDGETILNGGTGDNGHPDADQVWRYLKSVGLRPTEHFPEFDPKKVEDGFEITGDINLKVTYGGEINLKSIDLQYEPNAEKDRFWKVDLNVIESNFNRRLISRRLASLLNDQRIPD